MFPLLDPELRDRVLREIVPVYLADNTRARRLDSSGVFDMLRPGPGDPARRCQLEFLEQRSAAAAPAPAEPGPPAG
jgi:hypothetical protein